MLNTECPICLEEIIPDSDSVIELVCKHGYHKNCLEQLQDTSNACGLCKHDIVDPQECIKDTLESIRERTMLLNHRLRKLKSLVNHVSEIDSEASLESFNDIRENMKEITECAMFLGLFGLSQRSLNDTNALGIANDNGVPFTIFQDLISTYLASQIPYNTMQVENPWNIGFRLPAYYDIPIYENFIGPTFGTTETQHNTSINQSNSQGNASSVDPNIQRLWSFIRRLL